MWQDKEMWSKIIKKNPLFIPGCLLQRSTNIKQKKIESGIRICKMNVYHNKKRKNYDFFSYANEAYRMFLFDWFTSIENKK